MYQNYMNTYNLNLCIKRFLLISLFIIISLRILQQLYFRTNFDEVRSNGQLVEQDVLVKENHSFNGHCIACTSGVASYSDIVVKVFESDGLGSISGKTKVYDKDFFLKKRLIYTVNNQIIKELVSLDVWKANFTSFKRWLVEAIVTRFRVIYYSSISDVVLAMLLGVEGSGNSNVRYLFNVTGTQHLLAISGFNLSFLVAVTGRLYAKFFSKSSIIFLNLVIISFYVSLVGFSPGIFRAFCMFFISYLAWSLCRQRRALFILFLTLMCAILLDLSILSSISFQLSFVATAGIIMFSRIFSLSQSAIDNFILCFPRGMSSVLRYFYVTFIVGLAAQIAVFPLVMHYFGKFSVIGILASALVGWMIPIILQFGIILAVVQFVLPFQIVVVASIPLFVIVSFFLFLLGLLSSEQFLIQVPQMSSFFVFTVYIIILLICGSILLIKSIKNIKQHDQIYHFFF